MILDLEPKLKKKRGEEFFALPEGIDDDWVREHQKALVDEQRQKIQKKFEKENEKLVADGQKEMKAKELEERMEVADEMAAKFKAERKKGKIEAEGKSPSVEKFEQNIEKLDERIATLQTQSEDRENNKEVALGTSKIVSDNLPPCLSGWDSALTCFAELHRSPPHGRLLEEVRRAYRALLLQDFAGEVRLGHQVCG